MYMYIERVPPERFLVPPMREDLSNYGLRAPISSTEIYESKQERTVFHEYLLQEASFALAEISEDLRRPPGVYEIK